MSGSHISVALCDSSRHGKVSVFTVHVVSATTGVVSQPDSKVLDFGGGFFWNLEMGKNELKVFLKFFFNCSLKRMLCIECIKMYFELGRHEFITVNK